jgi:HAD superfamily hydrolase (TIGR01490 family)
MRLAIFDIDGTLVRGSSERMFWRYLASHGKQGPRQIFSYLAFLVRYLPTGGIHTLKKNKAYLCGLTSREVDALGAAFVEERLMHSLYEPAVARVRAHLNAGDLVVLMSGTIESIARPLAAKLGVQQVCATLCSQRHGIFLAQPPEIHPFAAAKLNLARQIAKALGTDLNRVVAYGDSRQDVFLLAAAGTAVAVRPDGALRRFAEQRGWEIIDADGADSRIAS